MMLNVSAVMTPDDVALAVLDGLREERFLIVPHAEVVEHERRRALDRDRWLRGMQRLAADVPVWRGD
jgi:hypothetical protein